ncbi:unnamed protein product [Anisakis simplex]|uniref:RPAP1_N domain-containing protein n=1 Tax=Anisakis simplex TaxID=6269 RepID=A0A0M3J4W8_ANISI|nr:unnamed protein product [Anisakis simplex]
MSLDGALEAGSELMRSVEEDEKMPDNEKGHHHNLTTTHKPRTTPSSNSHKNRPHHHDERVKSQSAESAPESEPESEPTTKFVDQIQSSLKSLQSPSRKVAVIDDHASAERKPKRVEPSLSKLTNERRIAVDQQISTESDLDENSEATGDRHETTHGKTESASKTWPNSAIDYSDEDQLIEKLLQEEDTEKALAMLLDRMTAEAADKLHSDNNDKQEQQNSQKKPHSGELFHIRVKNRHSATSAEDEKYRKMTSENDHHAFSNKLSIQPSISFGSLAELDDGAATNEHQRGTSSNSGDQSPLNEIESLRATVKKMQVSFLELE